MNITQFYSNYLDCLNTWAGFEISLMEDFNEICHCEVDFIEILLVFEQTFSLNLLDNNRSRFDFATVHEFIGWAATSSRVKFLTV